MELRVCALCGEERPVERPECQDGHGADCPEAFCAACGAAVFLAPDLARPVLVGRSTAGSRRPRGRAGSGRGPGRRAS